MKRGEGGGNREEGRGGTFLRLFALIELDENGPFGSGLHLLLGVRRDVELALYSKGEVEEEVEEEEVEEEEVEEEEETVMEEGRKRKKKRRRRRYGNLIELGVDDLGVGHLCT